MSKTKITTKKFYNKWLYKITLRIPGVAILRLYSLSNIADQSFADINRNVFSTLTRAIENKDTLSKVCTFLLKYQSSDYGKRIQLSNIDLYTNDTEFYNSALEQFSQLVVHRFEPNPNTIDLLEANRSIIVSKLPHNVYQYRVFLLPHKMHRDDKQAYLAWVQNQPKIKISISIMSWFFTTDWNWDCRYILVEDEATLLMLKLRNPSVVGRVYNYVISDK